MNSIVSKKVTYEKNRNTILKDLNFTLKPGKIIGILGDNGSGKTTLLRLIAGLAVNYSGHLTIDDKEISYKTKEYISFSDNLSEFSPRMTVAQVLRFYASFYDDYSKEREATLLSFMELARESKLSDLSKGKKACLSLVTTLSRKTIFYLMDEPFDGIDLNTKEKTIKTLIQWIDEDSSIIFATHDILEVESVLDEVLFLKDGNILLHESIEKLRENYHMGLENLYRKLMKV